MLLSIIVPAFNEENNIKKLIEKLLKLNLSNVDFKKEIIVINDGSTDKTGSIIEQYNEIIKLHQKNYGKGRAVQNGIKIAKGDFVLIQDGDLEYDPNDIITMCKKLRKDKNKSVYGSRYLPLKYNIFPRINKDQSILPYLANIVFVIMFLIIYQKIITDPLTGYKLYPIDFFKKFEIFSNGFEADHEITAKLIKNNYVIEEVIVSYNPRTVQEGKKINFFDALKAIKTIIKYRF
ncbi:MAG: glycosyl transferase [Candidatus Pelagibacter sp.]|nr:glycosyl transferase [Candidatus Pelagibacter sp.]|tara:strand:+ start:4944 stop:5645 length:702 start_codon:yes stop_codon:yes gene_type:complete